MKFIYIVLMLIAWTSAELEIWDTTEIKNRNINLNDIVDRFNPFIVQFIKKYGLDPLKLPQVERKLWMKNPNFSEPMIYKEADLVLQSGILKGLSNLKRYNNATLTYADRLLKMDVGFEFKLLKGTYDYVVKLVFRLKGRIIALTGNVRAMINITFNTTDYTLTLNKLHLQVPSHIKVTVENKDGSVDWINTAIVYIVTPFFKETITNVVQEEASNAIRRYFNEINHKIAPCKMLTYILEYILEYLLLNHKV